MIKLDSNWCRIYKWLMVDTIDYVEDQISELIEIHVEREVELKFWTDRNRIIEIRPDFKPIR